MMKIFGNAFIKRRLAVIIPIIGMMAVACNMDSGDANRHDTDQGQLQVRMQWQTQSAPAANLPVSPSGDVCVDFGINWVRIQVKNPSGQVVANSSLVPCADRSARLDNIPAGSGYKVEVEGLIDTQVQWRGTKEGVGVLAGKSTEPVMIVMGFIGETQEPLTAEITPAHNTANVPTDNTVTIQFNKPMVPASINKQSIQVTCGGRPMAGSLTYTPETAQAVFQPDEALAVSTACDITVTTDVMDLSGQSLPKKLSSQFTTTIVWYVDSQISKSGNGKHWEEAFSTIAEAVVAADNGNHIWVKQGTYQPGAEILIDKPMVLLGGFDGTEIQHHQREWKSRKTVVDGKDEHRCFSITADGDIDGFTITSGAHGAGSAMHIKKSSPKITNCIFVDNSNITTGAMMRGHGTVSVYDGDPAIIRCIFKDNIINANYASGGAIFNSGGSPTISDCIFKANKVKAKVACKGGAIHNDGGKAATVVTNCLFEDNSVSCGDFAPPGLGGAICNTYGTMTISSCRFSNNNVKGIWGASGGAVCNEKSNVDIHNTSFYANTVSSMMNSDGQYSYSDGGAIKNSDTTASITNCTFSLNKAIIPPSTDKEQTKGGAISNTDGSNVTIVNSIMWNDWAATDNEIYNGEGSDTIVSYSYIKSDNNLGSHNFKDNPRLNGDLHLRFDSPCRIKADSNFSPKTDIDGDPRPTDIRADIGADQFVDSDDDHLPDYWENAYHVDISDGDEDNDGLTNLDEYHLNTDPTKAQSVNTTTLYGSVRNNGEYQVSERSILTRDESSYRFFLVFELSNSNPIKGAILQLELDMRLSYSKDIQVWDVATSADSFSKNISGQTGIDIYDDLGQGVLYSKYTIGPDDAGDVLSIHLNAAAVAAINSAIAGSGEFIVGIKLADYENGQIYFGLIYEDRVHQLVLIE